MDCRYLIYTFGLLAYFVPVVIVFLSWALFWKPQFSLDIDFLNLGLRIIGFIFTLFSTSALASLNFNDFHYYPSGGLIGDVVAQSMLGFFSLLAVNLILLTLLISGTTLLFGFSWLRLIDGLGALAIALCSRLHQLPSEIRNWQETRKKDKALRFDELSETLQEQPIEVVRKSNVNIDHHVILSEDEALDLEDAETVDILNLDDFRTDAQNCDAELQIDSAKTPCRAACCQ